MSNFGRNDSAQRAGPPPEGIRYRPAQPEERTTALRLVLGAAGRMGDEAQVVEFLRFAVQRGIQLSDLWLAEEGGNIITAILPIVSPGRTMLLLVPGGNPDSKRSLAATQLLHSVCDVFRTKDVRLAQVLLDPRDATVHTFYAARSFRRVAELIYLQAFVARKMIEPALPPRCRWLTYSPEAHELFAATISESYRQSLDCPALNGLRDMEDILAGHKASGEFDPSSWFLLVEDDASRPDPVPLGVLLLSRTFVGDAMELVYLGLTPAARGRGFGDAMMRQALATVSAKGVSRLTLAVDSANAPALRLYYRHGMQRIGSKLAMMRVLNIPSASERAPRPGLVAPPA